MGLDWGKASREGFDNRPSVLHQFLPGAEEGPGAGSPRRLGGLGVRRSTSSARGCGGDGGRAGLGAAAGWRGAAAGASLFSRPRRRYFSAPRRAPAPRAPGTFPLAWRGMNQPRCAARRRHVVGGGRRSPDAPPFYLRRRGRLEGQPVRRQGQKEASQPASQPPPRVRRAHFFLPEPR